MSVTYPPKGDMRKAVYDSDDDGVVEQADTAISAGNADTVDGAHASDFANTVHTHGLSDLPDIVNITKIIRDTSTNKPPAGTVGRLFFETDTHIIYYDDGTQWVKLGVVDWANIDGKPSSFPPDAHTHPVADLTDHNKATHDALGIDADTVDGLQGSDLEQAANKGVANGYAPLDANAQVPVANLPDAVKTSNLQDVTAFRSENTVYQNTTGKHLLVIVTIDLYIGTYAYAYGLTGAASNTLIYQVKSREGSGNHDLMPISFIVPPNYYYKVEINTNTRIDSWWEVTI